ncbi:PREDICTED: E3 ubiquitin ligase BIG BROTHER-related isoform X2 [Nelumbo nucifera]|uniref:E3 ubiquitin ligase BIG BROTHER-related isoform X2 n=1 Tax=Nelumbo nucifera TaxID=4432 RepID=A0A1U8B938_NELNU|nr:PREDICTED: E3 ubiquitin ligase BIG BROTHER-related isoform X2 [Nelumbo nucifera]
MDDEETRQASRRVLSIQLDQEDSDLALAMSLQEQDRGFLMFTLSETDEEEDYNDGGDEGVEDGGDNMDLLEDGDANDEMEFQDEEDEDMEEDDLDPDDLSYEELIALGEIVGKVNKGLPADAVTALLHPYEFKCQSECKNGLDRCVICQVEYEEGESLVALPCEHPYHSDCISKWLQIKRVCPICSTEVSPSEHSSSALEKNT